MKKLIAILLSCILGTALLVGCGDKGKTVKEPQKQPQNSQQEKQEQNSQQESGIERIKLNQLEKFKGAELKVLNVKEAETVSNEAGKTKASGKFVIIEVSMKNTSKEVLSYSPNDFKLLNNGTEYQKDDNSFETLQNLTSQKIIYDENKSYVGPYDNFNPGITKKTYIVFDVPQDLNLKDTKLIVGGNEDIQFDLTK